MVFNISSDSSIASLFYLIEFLIEVIARVGRVEEKESQVIT